MSDEIIITILLLVSAGLAFYAMYQDWRMEQYKGYIERMEREQWSDANGQPKPSERRYR